MSPTKISTNGTLEGLAAQFAGLPMAETPRGGAENSFRGESLTGGADHPNTNAPAQANPFQGLGPVLEDDDADVFKQTEGLILRQELLAKNHLAQDAYYTCLIAGYPWAILTHDTKRDVYDFSLPYGGSEVEIQAVPNKALDLVNKATATVLSDFPVADVAPIDDTEEAEAAADLANRVLADSASDRGTNDPLLFDDRLRRALVTASSYVEGWIDPVGGGSVPLTIQAHPQAVSPDQPLVGPNGEPTTELIDRYVTAPQGGQFTDDPNQAAPQWQPAIRPSLWGREHVRVFPETATVETAEKVIILGHCTVGEAKRRWKTVGQMAPEDLSALTDWTPPRYLVLLPPFQRARWKLEDGRREKAGSSDQREMFYYHIYQRATPDYPRGADVVVSGAFGGLILFRDTLTIEAEGTAPKTREIPIVQVTPRLDPNGRDPSGVAWVEQFVGATKNTAALAMGFSEALDKILHTPFAINATSPIEGWQVDDARASGDMLLITTPGDLPTQLEPPAVPPSFFEMFDLADQATNSMASQERAAQGAPNAREKSGKAISLEISRNNLANTPLQTAVNAAIVRWNRIKLELAQTFTVPQLVRYVGEDGAYKTESFIGSDLAGAGRIATKTGTGTMMTPDQKIEYWAQLRANGMADPDEALEAVRPIFSKQLGAAPNPHEQRVERAVAAWLDGPPLKTVQNWIQAYQAWQQANAQFQQQQATYQQQLQQFTAYQQHAAIVAGGPPNPLVGPEGQNAAAMDAYQQAVIATRVAQQIAVQTGYNPAILPVQPTPPQVPKPWTPFTPRPNDTEPAIAAIWVRKLSRAMSTTGETKYGPEWMDVLNQHYTAMRQAAAVASGASPQNPAATQHPSAPTPRPPQAHAA